MWSVETLGDAHSIGLIGLLSSTYLSGEENHKTLLRHKIHVSIHLSIYNRELNILFLEVFVCLFSFFKKDIEFFPAAPLEEK